MWKNDFPLNKINTDKTDYINKEARVCHFIDETKIEIFIILEVAYQMKLLIK